MKVLKGILITIGIIVALFLIVAIFLPSSYVVERSLEIQQPIDRIFSVVVDLNQRSKWDPWLARDPKAETTITGLGNEPGSSWSWKSKTIGSGTLTIKKVIENESIESDLSFISPQSSKATIFWDFSPIDSMSTNVTWGISGDLAYPVERYIGLLMDKMIGVDFNSGLANLKAVVEKEPKMKETEVMQ